MALTDSGLKALLPKEKKYRVSVGDALFVIVYLMPKQVTAPRFLRLPEVLQMTGMGKTFIYDRMNDGTFPKQIQLGGKSVVWNEQEVTKWMEHRMANR